MSIKDDVKTLLTGDEIKAEDHNALVDDVTELEKTNESE